MNKHQKINDKIIIELSEISKEWKEDSIGCEQIRKTIIKENRLNYDSLIGLHIQFINKYLGKPNKIFIRNKEINFYYFLGCMYAPKLSVNNANSDSFEVGLDKTRVNIESARLQITFSEDSIVIGANQIVP